MVDVLKKVPVDPLIDWSRDPVGVDEQDGDSAARLQASTALEEKGTRDTIELNGGARRHRFFKKVSSIHEQHNSENQISILAPLRSRAEEPRIKHLATAK